ncbi:MULTISPECIES: DUF1236 domain-containing protein [unclassified Bradyrhizobium]|uniref:DUF1236 domain-containing protein n=1 Tax=unclassified Bradyrhizobium TaxID=2631580 RepID=UPI0028E265A3|nr:MULTISPECIES: DUF1236 domain-containing protein [unclassified Bradyrhizobium]
MTNRLMVSVAAIALLAGAGFAHAQSAGGAGGAVGQSGGAAGGMNAPGGTMHRDSASPAAGGASDMRSSQSDQKSGATKGQRAEEGMKGPTAKGATSESDKAGSKSMKAESRDSKSGTSTNAETKTGSDRSQTTTGLAGAGAKLTTEQRTKITSVIRSQRVEPVTNVNFNISVGTRVPRDVHFHRLPAEVVTIYPEWRGYDFILVREQIIVIDPRTHEIVAVLDA